jgi:choline dehydrogenase
MSTGQELPRSVDVIVVGSGSAGAPLAAMIAEGSDAQVLVLEAGPDYGPRDSGRWPADLIDAAVQPINAYDPATRSWLVSAGHDWEYTGEVRGRTVAFSRAKVLGGCSSHNGGAVVLGSRTDYDAWAAAGNPGWTTDEVAPLFASAYARLEGRPQELAELSPFQDAWMQAIAANGIPIVDDLNVLEETRGVAPFPLVVSTSGFRVNCAFGYLDPLRESSNLTVVGDAEVERLELRDGRVEGVVVRHDSEEVVIHAGTVVVSGGAYGSPAILLRSGIGPESHLSEVGVNVTHHLPGVGENLHDQPAFPLSFTGTPELIDAMGVWASENWAPHEQVIAKYPSSLCDVGFDMHIYGIGGPMPEPHMPFSLAAAVLRPLSRGTVRLSGPSSADRLLLDHAYLSDPEGIDLRRLVEGVELMREITHEPELAALLGEELLPGSDVVSTEALTDFITESLVHYYHPAGSCKMGPASDPTAVVGADGAVHGIEGLFVADASIMPMVTSGNTHIPTVMIGLKIGGLIAARG